MTQNLNNWDPKDITRFLIAVPSGFVGEFYPPDMMFRIINNADKKYPEIKNATYMVAELHFPDRKTSLEYDAPSLNAITDLYCSLLSLIYGKSIYNIGIIFYNGNPVEQMPVLLNRYCEYPVYTETPRHDYPLNLDFSLAMGHIGRYRDMFEDDTLRQCH